MSDQILTSLTVNGDTHELLVAPERTLLTVLRDDLRLTGAKRGCDEGVCGACLVLVDGAPVCACISLAVTMNGRAITTIEGLETAGRLHPVQQAFVQEGAVQCGFCMPGMLLSAKALLDRNPRPTIGDIRHALGSNLCRCSGYTKVVSAIASLAREDRGE